MNHSNFVCEKVVILWVFHLSSPIFWLIWWYFVSMGLGPFQPIGVISKFSFEKPNYILKSEMTSIYKSIDLVSCNLVQRVKLTQHLPLIWYMKICLKLNSRKIMWSQNMKDMMMKKEISLFSLQIYYIYLRLSWKLTILLHSSRQSHYILKI